MMKFWLADSSLFLTAFIFTFFLFGCKKKSDNLGLSIQPQGDQLNIVVSDSTKIISYCKKGDSIRTDELSGDNLLGSYVDPYFGKVESSIFAQVRLSSSINFIPSGGSLADLEVDSAVLYLKLSDAYGNLTPQTFEVYQLNEQMYLDSTYYSTSTLDSLPSSLVKTGEEVITPNLSPGTVGGTVVDAAILSIPLDVNTFAWNIINQSGTSVLQGNDGSGEFVEWFKGLLIKTNNNGQNVNEGAILYADLLNENSKIVIYYRNTVLQDTMKFDLNFNTQSARFHRIHLDNTGFYVGNEIADSTLGQDLFFTQTMGGVKGKIYFPNLLEYVKDKQVIVNKAELILPIQYFPSDKYFPAGQLFLTRINEEGKEVFIDDFASTLGMGGIYDVDNNQYIFNVTRYVNKVFAGEYPNKPLSILANKSGITANRVIFNGQETALKDKPKLKLTFTKY